MNKKVEEMTREELEQEVTELRHRYIWGLQAEDFAMTLVGSQHDDVDISEAEVFTSDELPTDELYKELQKQIKSINFNVYEWDLSITEHEYTPEIIKMLKTIVFRKLV